LDRKRKTLYERSGVGSHHKGLVLLPSVVAVMADSIRSCNAERVVTNPRPFSSREWLSTCAEVSRGSCVDGPCGLLVLQRRLLFWTVGGVPLPKSATPLSTGLDGEESQNSLTLHELSRFFSTSNLHLLQVTSSTVPPSDLRCSRVEIVENLEIDLAGQSCAALWGGIASLPKRNIRKALKIGVKVHRVHPSDMHLSRHWEFASRIYSDQGQRPVNTRAHHLAMGAAPLSESLKIFAATLNGESIGYLLTVIHGNRSYYWDVAIGEAGRKVGAGHLLMWVWLRWCKRNAVEQVDLVGPPTGGRAGGRAGIGRFKASFGAVPRPYYVVYWTRAGAGSALDLSRRLSVLVTKFREFWNRSDT
jgi:hypothetical protein